MTAPPLLMHGRHVKIDRAERMVQALREAGKPVDYIVFKREGHGLEHWTGRLRHDRKLEDLLAGCLGGRSGGLDWFALGVWVF